MSVLKTFAGASLAAAVTATSFAGDFKPAQIPSDFSRLVPDGAWAVVYTPSLNHLVQELMPVARAIDPQAAQALMMAPMMMQMIATTGEAAGGRPAPPAQFHLDKPMGLALGPNNPETGEPAFTVIISAKDAGKVRMSNMGSGPSEVVHLPGTDYVALTNRAFTPGAGPNALCSGMFAADIAINLDQAAVVKAYGTMIESGLQMMNMPMPLPAKPTAKDRADAEAQKRMQEYNLNQIRAFLNGFETWNLGIDLDATNLDLLAQYTLTPDSTIPRAAGSSKQAMQRLCQHVAADMPIQFVMNSASLQAMMDFNAGSEDLYPPATRAKIAKLMPLIIKSITDIRTGMAGGVALGADGMQVMEVMDARDPAAMISGVRALFELVSNADLGFSASEFRMVAGDGVGYKITVDPEQMMTAFGGASFAGMPGGSANASAQLKPVFNALLGGDSIDIRYVRQRDGDLVGVALGNDMKLVGQLRKLMAKGTKSSPVGEALEYAWAKPTWAISMEMRTLLSQGMELVKVMVPPIRVMMPKSFPAGDPIVLDMIGSATETADQIRIRTDIQSWISLIKQFQTMAAGQARGGA